MADENKNFIEEFEQMKQGYFTVFKESKYIPDNLKTDNKFIENTFYRQIMSKSYHESIPVLGQIDLNSYVLRIMRDFKNEYM